MARLERDRAADGPIVQGFSGGGFAVDGTVYRGLFLTPLGAWEWMPPAVTELAAADLEPLLGLDPAPEFVLLGTGRSLVFPGRAFIREVEARGIGVEVMDSRAAARTWGLLRAEERWIAAALMPIG